MPAVLRVATVVLLSRAVTAALLLSRVAMVVLLSRAMVSSSRAVTLLLLVARLVDLSRAATLRRRAALLSQVTLASRRTVAALLPRRGTRCEQYKSHGSQKSYFTYGANCVRKVPFVSFGRPGNWLQCRRLALTLSNHWVE
jgi:hypothetical protein